MFVVSELGRFAGPEFPTTNPWNEGIHRPPKKVMQCIMRVTVSEESSKFRMFDLANSKSTKLTESD